MLYNAYCILCDVKNARDVQFFLKNSLFVPLLLLIQAEIARYKGIYMRFVRFAILHTIT